MMQIIGSGQGREVSANGVDTGRRHHGELGRAAEAAFIDESLGVLREMSGQPVTGWLSPAHPESANRLDLLSTRGVDHVCDWYNDDMPFLLQAGSRVMQAMPHRIWALGRAPEASRSFDDVWMASGSTILRQFLVQPSEA